MLLGNFLFKPVTNLTWLLSIFLSYSIEGKGSRSKIDVECELIDCKATTIAINTNRIKYVI